MEIRAAVLFEQPGQWKVETVELDGPGHGEVLVEMIATGLCHSDDHFGTGDIPIPLPQCAGHEGGGIVREVGPGVTTLKEGDHVLTIFVPGCGHCRWCTQGMQNLCDLGASALTGSQLDGTFRMHFGDEDVKSAGALGTFSEWQVYDELSCVKVPDDLPLASACLLSCGVPTGWGAAVNAAAIRPGDVVIVMGVGGTGMSSVQGAAHAGANRIIAVDPVSFKREMALKLGATDAFADIAEAADFARGLTNGQGADATIVSVGVIQPERVAEAFSSIRKGGTVAVTSVGSVETVGIPVSLFELVNYQKRIQGQVFGMASPRRTINLLVDLYRTGRLKLDEMVTTRYTLDQINEAFADMHSGKNIRGVIEFS